MDEIEEIRKTNLLQRRTKELQAMVRVAQLINVLDLDNVLLQTLQLTAEVVGAIKGSFFLLDEHLLPMQRFITQRNMPPEMSRLVAHDVVEKGLAGWCIRHKAGAVVVDVEQDSRWHIFPDDEQLDVRSALCVPVMYEGRILGVMTLVNHEVGHFDEADLELVTAIANQASTAISNARLFDALQAHQHKLELVVQNTGDALLTVDSQFTLTMATPQVNAVLGVPPSEALTGTHLERYGELGAEIITRIREGNLTEGSHSFEVRDNARERDYAVNVAAMQHEDVLQNGYVIVLHEITSIKDLGRLKTHILHMLTHDLKNPMNIIWGYIDLLRVDSQQEMPADTRFIDGILRAVQRMELLIEETLHTEKVISQGDSHMQTYIEPLELIYEAIDDMRQLLDSKKLTLIEELQPHISRLLGNRLQVREAITNLIGNAIKYTGEGGRITVNASSGEGRFYFSVTDTGIGIPYELQPSLFTQYYRAQRPELAGIEGTGLGLSLVKSAVEQHRGQVWFKSEPGTGSTFGFWLPMIKSE